MACAKHFDVEKAYLVYMNSHLELELGDEDKSFIVG